MSQRAIKSFVLKACLVLVSVGLLEVSAAYAGNIWDGTNDTTLIPTGDPNWTNAANWNGDALPDFSTLTFAGTTGLANTNNNVGLAVTGPITFDATAGAFVITGNAITFGSTTAAGSANITNSSMNLQ